MSHHITWIGQRDRAEWNFAWQELAAKGAQTIQFYPTVAAAEGTPPSDLVVVAIARPGEHSLDAILDLQASLPNTRVVCLLGAWCSGLRRLSPRLADVHNLYVHELRSGKIREQLLAEPLAPESSHCNLGSMVAIYARTNDYSATLAESISLHFPQIVELRFDQPACVHGVDTVVWESSPYRDEWLAECGALAERHPEARLVALVNYPRAFERDEMATAGDVSVVGQPFQLEDLLTVLRERAEASLSRSLKISA